MIATVPFLIVFDSGGCPQLTIVRSLLYAGHTQGRAPSTDYETASYTCAPALLTLAQGVDFVRLLATVIDLIRC